MADHLAEAEEEVLDQDRIDAVLLAVESSDTAAIDALLEPLHAADIADLLEQISGPDRRALLRLWSHEIDGEILSEISDAIREEVIDTLPREVLLEAVRDLESDDVVDILEDLGQPQKDIILRGLEDADRVAVERSMAYPEYSAGRLMQRETVVAFSFLRLARKNQPAEVADRFPR